MDASGNDAGSVGLLDIAVVGMVRIGTVEATAVAQREGAAGMEGVVSQTPQVFAQALPGTHQLAQEAIVTAQGGCRILDVSGIGFAHESI